jgi:hypothetical protein
MGAEIADEARRLMQNFDNLPTTMPCGKRSG